MTREAIHPRPLPRREAAALAGSAGSSLSLRDALAGAKPNSRNARAKSVLLLHMDGGPSHIDLFDLKPNAPAEIRGPGSPIQTSVPGVVVGDYLPKLAKQMHHVAQVRSMTHKDIPHDQAVYHMLTGYRHNIKAGGLKVEPTDHPHIASSFYKADKDPTTLPASIAIPEPMRIEARMLPGQNAGRLGARWNPFPVHVTRSGQVIPPDLGQLASVTKTDLRQRFELLGKLQNSSLNTNVRESSEFQALQRRVLGILEQPSIQEAFDLSKESEQTHALYGRDRHGQSTLLARRLVEAGARFVTVYWGKEMQDWGPSWEPMLANNPWDTHRNHFPLIKDSLLPRADRTFAALLEDMNDRGLLDDTLVIWMGEFGRSPRISSIFETPGREHWPHAFTLLLAGAGVNGGSVYGKTDRFAEYVTENPVSPADFSATIYDALGIDPHTVIEGRHESHQLSTGSPVLDLFG
ncbi:MAG: DUF1501 domain-containing protein [Pirellulales bacterium]|nr:DUF1501 domain-containing protein [Pirellulales bacterium]